MGGEIVLETEQRLVCSYPGRFISALLWIAIGVFSMGIVVPVALAVFSDGGLGPLFGALPSALMVAWFAFLLRVRRRRMGVFVLDFAGGTLAHRRGARAIQQWPLADVRLGTVLDPFHRGWGFHYWLVARVPDGRRLRLGKGLQDEMRPVLQWLAQRGLTVE